ncbi:MAG TPA: DUF72 domain-containing protein, partial [Phycisphaerales bacterium]|nr:DUF72 domain-containing protein [Phycisphaerales bacterium]
YTHRQLADWARKCRRWNRQGKDVYCFFDNDQNGLAAQNALTLQQLSTEQRTLR